MDYKLLSLVVALEAHRRGAPFSTAEMIAEQAIQRLGGLGEELSLEKALVIIDLTCINNGYPTVK